MTTAAGSRALSSNPAPAADAPGGAVFVGAGPALPHDDALGAAARRAGMEAGFCWDVEEAQKELEAQGADPRCIVIDSRAQGLEPFIGWLRGQARLFPVPVVVQAPAPTDQAFLRAHAAGADDAAVLGDTGGIARRLANLAEFRPSFRPPLTQGAAVVAHGDGLRRQVLGRILRQAGFEVSFAVDGDDLVRVAHGLAEPPVLLVADGDLGSTGPLEAARAVRGRAGWEKVSVVVTAATGRMADLRSETARLGNAAVTHEGAPPDNLLFLANELLRPDVKNVRASTRLLYGTICAFRPAGEMQPVYGLTYNISREGLYVRTLDPPAPGTDLWIELRPPHGEGAVHLRAKSVWSRGLRNPGGAAPPGFGVRILEDESPARDHAAYLAGYEHLQTQR